MTIIKSLLDTDFYQFTMGQFVFHRYSDVEVEFGFNNRTTSVSLGTEISQEDLRRQLDAIRELRFTDDELSYLASLKRSDGTQLFRDDYLGFLRDLRIPGYSLEVRDGQLDLTFCGKWPEAIFWETPALAAISELYSLQKAPYLLPFHTEGAKRLDQKIQVLRQHPEARIIEFGTRRRFTRDWQRYVTTRLIQDLLPGQLVGTSNVLLAKDLGIKPIGTMAHQLFMVIAALNDETDESLRNSHNLVLREWWDEYGEDLSVALTDTFGTDFFFSDMTEDQAREWHGLRQDSGSPIEFGEKAQAFYQRHGIDTRTKQFVASDGLDIDAIVAILERFSSVFKISFGWGTNLTNDLGLKALSMVIKAIAANRRRTVKLSDNLAKAQGTDEYVQRYKHVFGHTATEFTPTIY